MNIEIKPPTAKEDPHNFAQKRMKRYQMLLASIERTKKQDNFFTIQPSVFASLPASSSASTATTATPVLISKQ